jgi:predicted CXXCH cytochrome family protein
MKAFTRWLALGTLGLVALLGLSVGRAQAAPLAPTAVPQTLTTDEQCLQCHSRPYLSTQLPSGEALNLTIDGAALASSLHGPASIHCASCHTDINSYPHPAQAAQNAREVAINFSKACTACHADEAAKQQDSIHQQALAGGNENAAVCSDCHNPHNTTKPATPRATIIATCGKCHSDMALQYSQSVHGVALINENNPDVPSCIDCHGVHNIASPVTAKFLLSSPQLCASCHTDAQKMAKYGLNTNVLNTYVADFHGTTVTLFAQKSPDQLPNKPLCIDCHGTHNIASVTAANSPVIQQNLLATCQQCHPNATTNFPAAWLSHYTPSASNNTLVFGVDLFYKILIPVVIGGMLIFVLTDMGRRLRAAGRRKVKEAKA